MVRVISVHHFVSQDIHTCEDPVAVTTAPPDYLLLALPQHLVEVRDLAKGGDVIFNFPTVDQVHQMLHCCNGNYVATLELKQNRQGKECTHARIYANWDAPCIVQQGATGNTAGMVQQPMRARIAGRVTPSSAQSGPPSLEMIELPVKRTPNVIACCQTTGNLLVASHKTLMLYHFHVRTHDISRLRFIDFEESGVCVELSFSPTWLAVTEDIIACMSQEHMHVFRLGTGGTVERWKNEEQLLEKKGEKTVNSDSHIDWDEILRGELRSSTKLKLHSNSFPLTVDLPSIAAERANSCSSSPSGVLQRHNPFQVAPPDMTIIVRCASPTATPWAAKNEVLHLLQLQMATTHLTSSTKQIFSSSCDEFRCLILKPMYIKTSDSQTSERKGNEMNPMHSNRYGELVSVICLVVTQQEGYLYHFKMQDLQEPSKLQHAACVTVYPFTAPVSAVVMERFVLHALTETGLETYTLRTGHHLIGALDPVNNVNNACPPVDDPVCLVGLRPFLGVEHLVVANSHLVLLACSEGSSSSSQDSSHCGGGWTLYSLSLPSPADLYTDILSVGSAHRWSSPTTYCHLLCEGHIILRTALATVMWKPGASEAIPVTFDEKELKKLEDLYRDSCALLADYYVTSDMEEDWSMAAPYYRMAGLTPMQVVERVRKIEIPPEVASDRENQGNLKGLMSYLHICLLHLNQAPGDMLFSPAVPSFAHTLLDLFEELDPAQVSTLVLHSSLLREYATDRVLGIMKKQLSIRAVPEAADALALVLLCIQRGSPEQAIAVLDSLSPDSLSKILLENPTLLLEEPNTQITQSQNMRRSPSSSSDSPPQFNKKRNSPPLLKASPRDQNVPSFSDLASILMDSKPAVLANVLGDLVIISQFATLQLVLQIFLEYIPSRIGIAGSAASLVLQMFLEKYFTWYFDEIPAQESPASYDMPTMEALKILVRSYLSDLQRYHSNSSQNKVTHIIDSEESEKKKVTSKIDSSWDSSSPKKVLFEDKRLPFLHKMPPFAADLSKRLVSLQEGVAAALENMKPVKNVDTSNDSLFKLQCLLCSGRLPRECLIEVHQFVQTHPQLHGNLSLQVMCVPPREAINILLDFCPQALLQYTKDKFKSDTEWKYLLLLLHRKVQALGDESILKPFYLQVTKDILTHLAQTLNLEDLCKILPPGGENMYRNYVQICQQVGHANHIRALIMATGQQLLTTLNL